MLANVNATLRGLPPRGKIGLGIVAGIVVAVLAFALGVSVGRPSHPVEGSPEVGFLRDMSSHHAQAVEMGMIAYRSASLPEVRELGRDIALTQQGQIGRMQGWLAVWGLPPHTTARPMAWLPNGESMMRGNLMPGMATREEIERLQSATGEQVDILFLQYMGQHHLGGIHMVQGLLDLNPSDPVRTLAETMKNGQQREIDAMSSLLTSLGAPAITD